MCVCVCVLDAGRAGRGLARASEKVSCGRCWEWQQRGQGMKEALVPCWGLALPCRWEWLEAMEWDRDGTRGRGSWAE